VSQTLDQAIATLDNIVRNADKAARAFRRLSRIQAGRKFELEQGDTDSLVTLNIDQIQEIKQAGVTAAQGVKSDAAILDPSPTLN